MDWAVVGFWVGLLIPAIGYVIYPLAVIAVARTRAMPAVAAEVPWPSVTVAIAAHNEEHTIARAVTSVLHQGYPGPPLVVLVGLDGCTDGTRRAVEALGDSRIGILDLPRAGKATTDNRLVVESRSDVVVTTSAGSEFGPGSLAALVAPLRDRSVGCTTGVFRSRRVDRAPTEAEGLYWRFEYNLMAAESRLGLLAMGSGTALAFRRSAFRPIPADSDADVVVAPSMALVGLRVVHEPTAVVFDDGPDSMSTVLRSRRRMALRALPATLSMLPRLARAGRIGVAGGLLAHKVFRWVTPAAALVWLVSAVALVENAGSPYSALVLGLATALAIGVVAGLAARPTRGAIASLGLAQLAFALALCDVARGRRARTWTREPV